MESMDSKVRQALEQGKELYKAGKSASQTSLNAVIATLAIYAANVDISSDLRSSASDLKARLEKLKQSKS